MITWILHFNFKLCIGIIILNLNTTHAFSTTSSTGTPTSKKTVLQQKIRKSSHQPSNISNNYSSIHLISLPSLSNNESPKIIKDIWKWKDIVLGDGRDYFIPRPRSLKALCDILVGSSLSHIVEMDENYDVYGENLQSYNMVDKGQTIQKQSLCHMISECAILSNCARLDILLCVGTKSVTMEINNMNDADIDVDTKQQQGEDVTLNKILDIQSLAQEAATLLVANCLHDQLISYQNVRKGKGSGAVLWEGMSSLLDLPGMVVTIPTDDYNDKTKKAILSRTDINESTSNLSKLMKSQSEIKDIILHFCYVAAGLAKRDSRPDRPVIFRPFSSRDAHIMLQLKRTVEVVVAMQYTKVKIILDTALNAGKAARDVNKVPILKQMKQYDCEGKYSTSAPPEIANKAIEDVKMLAIQPAVNRCLDKLTSQEKGETIVLFKRYVEEMITTKLKLKQDGLYQDYLKKAIHEVTMGLRNGTIEIDDAISNIERMLDEV